MLRQPIYHTYNRIRTLQTGIIKALPLVILMPHSACNCRCVMCDIWKGNKNLKQLTEKDVLSLLGSLKKLGTQQVLMSGGEALLNPNFFRFCEILQQQNIRISLLTTGITLKKHAPQLVKGVNDIIVSLDGNEETHNRIRNIPDAYRQLKEGIQQIRAIDPFYKIRSRTVIHKLNFQYWPSIIDSAKEIGIDQVSFLPADVSSHAFNREVPWNEQRQQEILPGLKELAELKHITETVIGEYAGDLASHFIAENPEKLRKIYTYYAAFHSLNSFPYKKCNAPWVSAVVEADGTVRPCFFHPPIGNIRSDTLETILNKEENIRFRKELNMEEDNTCVKCVCYLNLAPGTKLN